MQSARVERAKSFEVVVDDRVDRRCRTAAPDLPSRRRMSVTPALPERDLRAAPHRAQPAESRHTTDATFHDAVEARRAARAHAHAHAQHERASEAESDSGESRAARADASESTPAETKPDTQASKRSGSPQLGARDSNASSDLALEPDAALDDSNPLHATRATPGASDADATEASDGANRDETPAGPALPTWIGQVAFEASLKHTQPHSPATASPATAPDGELAALAGPALAISKASTDLGLAADALRAAPRDTRDADAASRFADPRGALPTSATTHAAKPASPAAPAPIRATVAELPKVFDRLAVHVHNADRKAIVELDPPELGRLSIALSLESGGRVRAEMRAERPSGYAALQSQLSQLHASLIERGFTSASVDLQLGLSNHDSQQSSAQRDGARSSGGARRTLADADVRALVAAPAGAIDMWA
jgi:flagellar hook-length control protein FliK